MAGLTTVTSGGIADGTITNADINSSASIDASKVSGLSTDSITEGNTTVECVDTGTNGHITFDTENTERMRILADGKVGINTTTPASPFNALGTGAVPIRFESTSSAECRIGFKGTTGENTYNVGVGSSGENLGFWTNNSQRVTVLDNGDVGIGETSPTATLHIAGGTAKPALYLYGSNKDIGYNSILQFGEWDGSTYTERMRIDSSGRLLIGTTASVTRDGAVPFLQVESSNSNAGAAFTRYSNDAVGPLLILSKARGSVGGNTIVQDDDVLGTILFHAADGNDQNSKAASISAAVDGTPGSNDMPARLVFSTAADGAQSPTERMRIDSGGKVGIGLADNTTYNLQVAGSSSGNQFAIGDSSPRLILDYKSPSSSTVCPQITSDGEGLYYYGKNSNANSAHKFHAGSSNTEEVRIDGDGLKFNGDTSSANALDDYEEGTWTPVWQQTVNSGTFTAVGTYVKIGRQVTLEMKQTGGTVSANLGAYIVSGAPFAPNVGSNGAAGTWTDESPQQGGQLLLWTSGKIYTATAISSEDRLLFSITYQSSD